MAGGWLDLPCALAFDARKSSTRDRSSPLKFELLVLVGLVTSLHPSFHDLTLLLLPSILILRNTMGRNVLSRKLRSLDRLGWGPLRVSVWGMLAVILLLSHALRQSEPSDRDRSLEILYQSRFRRNGFLPGRPRGTLRHSRRASRFRSSTFDATHRAKPLMSQMMALVIRHCSGPMEST